MSGKLSWQEWLEETGGELRIGGGPVRDVRKQLGESE